MVPMSLRHLPLNIRRDLALAKFFEKARWSDLHHPILGTKCREWTSKRNQDEYGIATLEIALRGLFVGVKLVPDSERANTVMAHRLAWAIAHGPIPDGLHVLHKCDNPPCIADDHLFLGTHQDNMADMMAKGRSHWQRRDTEFWCCLCFETRDQKDAFLKAAGLFDIGDKYLDGRQVARKLGIDPGAKIQWPKTRAHSQRLEKHITSK